MHLASVTKLFPLTATKKQAFVILTPGFPASGTDSVCLPMQQSFVKTILQSHPQLQVIVLSFQYPYHERSYKWFGATVISFNGRNKGGLPRLLLRKKINAALQKIHGEKQIVGLLSFWLNECAAAGKRFGIERNIPHYCWLLGQDARKGNKYVSRLEVRADELIALSDFLQEEFERNYGIRPFAVIPPGREVNQAETGIRNIDILGVGSLIPLKQFEIFVAIVAGLKKIFPSIKAELIGAGPDRGKLESLITEYGLKENLSLNGEIRHEEVLQKMTRAKIFLHPSSYEGFSGVCAEALSLGAHVISFCRAMNSEIDQWHIVNTKDEMQRKAMELLSRNLEHRSSFPYKMEESVSQMLDLFSPVTVAKYP